MRTRLLPIALTIAGATLAGALLAGPLTPARPADAALQVGDAQPQVLVGRDDDNSANRLIDADAGANQNLRDADIVIGRAGNDVLIGRLGNDLLRGGQGDDILLGGPDSPPPFSATIQDVLMGEGGDDAALWGGTDGNEAFLGGDGRDALVVGAVALDPTAAVTTLDGFCALERVPADSTLGYEWLVRFTVRSTGRQVATARLAGVEQVFCAGQPGGQVVYADLPEPEPAFAVVPAGQIGRLNPLVGAVIR
jgi:hypothetical protein